MATINVTPNSPLNLTQPQQTFNDEVVIQGGQIMARDKAVNVTFKKLVKSS